jgi:hypothetical protein
MWELKKHSSSLSWINQRQKKHFTYNNASKSMASNQYLSLILIDDDDTPTLSVHIRFILCQIHHLRLHKRMLRTSYSDLAPGRTGDCGNRRMLKSHTMRRGVTVTPPGLVHSPYPSL